MLTLEEYRLHADLVRSDMHSGPDVQELCDHILALCDELVAVRKRAEAHLRSISEMARELVIYSLATSRLPSEATAILHIEMAKARQACTGFVLDASGEIERPK